MDTLNDLITALTDPKYAADLNTPVRVVLYGVTQKAFVRVEKIIENGQPKIVLYLEEFDQATQAEKISAIAG